MNCGSVDGSAGHDQTSLRRARKRANSTAMRRSPSLFVVAGMFSITQGRNISTVQPSSVLRVLARHGPSQLLMNRRSGSSVPSINESPSLTRNQ